MGNIEIDPKTGAPITQDQALKEHTSINEPASSPGFIQNIGDAPKVNNNPELIAAQARAQTNQNQNDNQRSSDSDALNSLQTDKASDFGSGDAANKTREELTVNGQPQVGSRNDIANGNNQLNQSTSQTSNVGNQPETGNQEALNPGRLSGPSIHSITPPATLENIQARVQSGDAQRLNNDNTAHNNPDPNTPGSASHFFQKPDGNRFSETHVPHNPNPTMDPVPSAVVWGNREAQKKKLPPFVAPEHQGEVMNLLANVLLNKGMDSQQFNNSINDIRTTLFTERNA